MMLIIFAILSISISLSLQSFSGNLNDHWCYTCDDPHANSFDQKSFEFQFTRSHTLMYTDYGNTRVTAGYKPCNDGSAIPTCNCGVHVRSGADLLFLDNCGAKVDPLVDLKFNHYDSSTTNPVDCAAKTVPVAQQTDDAWWAVSGNAVVVGTNKFLCAKIDNLWNTYMIRTKEANAGDDIYVKVMLHDAGISCIYVRPSLNSYQNAGGICGNFNENNSDDLFTWNYNTLGNGSPNNGYNVLAGNEASVAAFWKLETNQPAELDYKELTVDDCPCDASLPAVSDACPTNLAQCLRPSTFVAQNYVRGSAGGGRGGGEAGQQNPVLVDAARQKCNQIFPLARFDDAVAQGVLTIDQLNTLKDLCTRDILGTNDLYWAVNLAQVGQNWALETCATLVAEPKPDLCAEYKTPIRCSYTEFSNLFSGTSSYVPCPRPNGCLAK